jgi:hypothetical protein
MGNHVILKMNSPKKVLFDTGDGIHAAHLCPRTNQLHPNVRSDLDHHVLVICELRRGCVWVELDIGRDELRQS